MTAVVGLVQSGSVYIGADSAGVRGPFACLKIPACEKQCYVSLGQRGRTA